MARSWSNIPDDIVGLFINRLSYVDQIRFQAVCKNWQGAAKTTMVKYADKLPWIMAYGHRSCFLYDPSHKQQYTVFSNDASRAKSFAHARVLDSKYGWVLFSKFSRISTSAVFLYSPFTDKMIQLPKLLLTSEHVATFTTTPVSSDCLIFVLSGNGNPSPAKNRISMCKPGDTEWMEFPFDCPPEFPFGCGYEKASDVEYVNGVFYVTFPPFAIGCFNVALKEWKMHLYSYPQDELLYDLRVTFIERLTECDGDLLLSQYLRIPVYEGPTIRFDESQKWRIYKLDWSRMRWFQVESSENRSMLFLGNASISVLVEKGSELANTLHIHFKNESGPLSQPSCPQISEIYEWRIEEFFIRKLWIQPPDPKLN